MQSKISKSLEAIIERTTNVLRRDDIKTSYIDRLVVELLGESGTFASQLLHSLVGDKGHSVILRRVLRGIITSPKLEVASPEECYALMCQGLSDTVVSKRISTAHVLYYAAQDTSTATSYELRGYDLRAEDILEAIDRIVDDKEQPSPSNLINGAIPMQSESVKQSIEIVGGQTARQVSLDSYGENLTERARRGEIDLVVGRDAEIERVVQILARRKKCNPILIGEAGVGKSAIVEALAQRIAEGRVPEQLRGKELYALDMAMLVAGTKFRGEFEQRMREILDVVERERSVILFIDEIHTIVGAGASQGALDIANMLKPMLARGKVQTIGATTIEEYSQTIERDSALERRFQPVRVEPMSREATREVLSRVAPHYGDYHSVRYSREAIDCCLDLAERYITERHLPDKALDLLDEAGVWARIDTAMRGTEPVVAPEHVLHVASLITGIPRERLSPGRQGRMLTLADHLSEVVVGQRRAAECVARAMLRVEAGLASERRPLGVFLFVGASGVGKTLMAKELARWMTGSERNMVRIDMSEYQERHTLSRLVGSPPGYVGYGEGGELTDAVRRNPYTVLLLDEVDKAHAEVFNIMLPLFDEGRLSDSMGRVVDFSNVVVIMTANIPDERGAKLGYTLGGVDGGVEVCERQRRRAEAIFSKELVNRIDEVVVFNRLTYDDILTIARREVVSLVSRAARRDVELRVADEVANHIAANSVDARYGARELRRSVVAMLEQPLSELIVSGATQQGDVVVAEIVGDEVVLRVERAKVA